MPTGNGKPAAFLAHAQINTPIQLLKVGILSGLAGSHAIVVVQLQNCSIWQGVQGVRHRGAHLGCQPQIDSAIDRHLQACTKGM